MIKKIKGDVFNFKEAFGLYIHIPFCQQKCAYCDFYSLEYSSEMIKEYLQALKKEIIIFAKNLACKNIKTIYLGGGSPSLLSIAELADLFNTIFTFFNSQIEEITIELNPTSLTKEKISAYKKLGITRLSLGVQSFQKKDLKVLERLQAVEETVKIISQVKKEFNNYNIDLIFAIPEQGIKEWEENLKKLISFNPAHISLYNLQIEEGTPLEKRVASGEIVAVTEELDADMYLLAQSFLDKAGYQQYEISNFAQAGFYSLHNLIYWQYQPYLGLGTAAHSFTTETRFANPANVEVYIKSLNKSDLAINFVEKLSLAERMAEMVFLGLRLKKGVFFKEFKRKFKIDIKDVYQKQLTKLTNNKLVHINNEGIKLTQKGLLLANEVFREFLP